MESIILGETMIGQKHVISLTESLLGFYKRNEEENRFINRLIVTAKLGISKFKYRKNPNLIFLFKNEKLE